MFIVGFKPFCSSVHTPFVPLRNHIHSIWKLLEIFNIYIYESLKSQTDQLYFLSISQFHYLSGLLILIFQKTDDRFSQVNLSER